MEGGKRGKGLTKSRYILAVTFWRYTIEIFIFRKGEAAGILNRLRQEGGGRDSGKKKVVCLG